MPPSPLNGFSINKCAVALFASSTTLSFASLIFLRASASHCGFLVSIAPDASAKYSLCLDAANLII